MLVVRVEYWPFGDGGNARELCSLRFRKIAEDEATAKRDYAVTLRTSNSSKLHEVGILRGYDATQHLLQLVGLGALFAVDWMKTATP